MTNIELYINERLCDIQNPESLGVRLNRVLINPAELSSKDAQYSYSITIPSTPINDAIFSYVNVEEVKNKFNVYHTAQLYVDGVLIFDGRFKMNEIDGEGNYKGNLVLPAKKTIKEIFGEKKMNEVGEWIIDFDDKENGKGRTFAEFITFKNKEENAVCIFPLVLYGLLPKQIKEGSDVYTKKKVWDDTVRLGIADFPPSINCMQTIKQIFSTLKDKDDNQINIVGSAFEDPRLTKLYMSYQNPTDYEQPWNWGKLGRMKLHGKWTNINNDNKRVLASHIETQFFRTTGDFDHIAFNLFNSRNAKIDVIEDLGNSIIQTSSKREDNITVQNTHITIPVSGYYKVKFSAKIEIIAGDKKGSSNKDYGLRFAYYNSENTSSSAKEETKFDSIRYELKLLRSRGDGEFDMENQVIDGVFYKKNQRGDYDPDGTLKEGFPKFKTFPKYFPQPGEVQFIDQSQNKYFVCGLHWGVNCYDDNMTAKTTNPLNTKDKEPLSWVMAAKSGLSWDAEVDEVNYCAINSKPYYEYGFVKSDAGEESEEERLGYKIGKKFKIDMPKDTSQNKESDLLKGDGSIDMIVWFDKGEHLTLVDIADIGRFNSYRKNASIKHEIVFDLELEPYQIKQDWLKVGLDGSSTEKIVWDDDNVNDQFKKSEIDLMKFLPSEVKVDEWLENFCKAFNLQLIQPEAEIFELNVKPVITVSAGESVIDLDGKASLAKANNQPLGLPSEYKLGFKIEKEEEGYVRSKTVTGEYKDGGGTLVTGSLDGQVVSQTSNFSYNWFKEMTYMRYYDNYWSGDPNGIPSYREWLAVSELKYDIPVITSNEIWNKEDSADYLSMMPKLYTNYAQRFWYKKELIYHDELLLAKKFPKSILNRFSFALVTDRLEGDSGMVLNYYNTSESILATYFNIIATDDSNYTYVECYLTPDEYDQMDGTKLIKLNSDLYYVAAVEGYDPLGRNKTKLKLIRKV